MTKKKKIILISVAVTVALVMTVGGLAYGQPPPPFDHEDVGGHKLIGVGEMGYAEYPGQDQWWDTQFIITNPNCERYLTIEWVALIAGDDAEWDAEEVIAEGTPKQWRTHIELVWGVDTWPQWLEELEIPDELSGHEVWQVSIAELIAAVEDEDPEFIVDYCDLGKYTLEVTWTGARYYWWRWSRVRPLTGWQKEKCWYLFEFGETPGLPGFAISEAEMELFPSRTRFQEGEPYFPFEP